MGVFSDTCKWYASQLRFCGTSKLSVSQNAVKFASYDSYDEYDTQFDLKVLDSLGGLASVDVLSCGLVRACEIAFSINLLVFSYAAVHAWVILFRSLDTLSMKLYSSCVIMVHCYKMTVNQSWWCTSWLWCDPSIFWLTNGILLYMDCL